MERSTEIHSSIFNLGEIFYQKPFVLRTRVLTFPIFVYFMFAELPRQRKLAQSQPIGQGDQKASQLWTRQVGEEGKKTAAGYYWPALAPLVISEGNRTLIGHRGDLSIQDLR